MKEGWILFTTFTEGEEIYLPASQIRAVGTRIGGISTIILCGGQVFNVKGTPEQVFQMRQLALDYECQVFTHQEWVKKVEEQKGVLIEFPKPKEKEK